MGAIYDKVQACVKQIREKTAFVPRVAVILGSGLGDYAEDIRVEMEIPYSDIQGFPVSTVSGHDGRFIFGYVDSVPVVCMKGRVHFYEGYGMKDVVLPIRVMRGLGAEILFVTNAAGGLNPEFTQGDLMLITDHISLFVQNPLIGENEEKLGARFPDMSRIYDGELCDVIRTQAQKNGIILREGVYTQLSGPSYETPAEIRLLKALGTDAVGMSTVVETIAANHMGMRICGISCITNMAAGISKNGLNHEEVKETADRIADSFKRLVTDSIRNFG